MDSTKCKVFITSVELGSFSKAAAALGYTISGVSHLVNAFEKEMGFPLLTRDKKGVKPTNNALKIIPVQRGNINIFSKGVLPKMQNVNSKKIEA